MDNLIEWIVYLPVLVVAVGLFLLIFFVPKSTMVVMLRVLAGVALFYYISDGVIVNPNADVHTLVKAFVAVPFLSPLTLGYIICMIWVLYYERPLPWHQCLWFVWPVALSSVCLMLYLLISDDEAARFQALYDQLRHFPESYASSKIFQALGFIEHRVYRTTMFVYTVYAVGFAIYVLHRTGLNRVAWAGFFFKGSSLPPVHILLLSLVTLLISIMLRVLIGRYVLMDHLWLNITFSFFQCFCMILMLLSAFSLEYVECTLRQFWFLDPKDDLDSTSADDAMSDDNITDDTDNDTYLTLQERLVKGLHDVMEVQRAYLDCNLRMADVARALGTNRNYLSHHINEKYQMNFNEYVNRMRIEYSKQYMREHPDMLLDTIAAECGFGTAQVFSRKFKSMEGVTPRSWLVQQGK